MRAFEKAFLAATLLAGIGAGLLSAYGTWGVAGEWQWQHAAVARVRWWMPVAPAIALTVFAVWLLRRARREARVSAAWGLAFVLLAFILQLSTLAMAPASTVSAGAVILSPVATTYFTEAAKVPDLREFLRDYANRMRTFSQHAQTYPPGPILFFWCRQQIVERSPAVRAFVSYLIVAVTGLTPADLAAVYSRLYRTPVTPALAAAAILSAWQLGFLGCASILVIFVLARARWGAAAAVCAGALAATVPSLILFTPSILQFITLETALTLYLFHLAWSRRSAAWAIAAGAMWTISALTSLAMLAVPPLLVLWAAGDWLGRKQERPSGSAWPVVAAWLVGALGLFALAYLILGINFPAIMRSALAAHREVTTRVFARTYWRWLGWNLFDFWMFLGAGLGLWLLRQLSVEAAAARKQWATLTPLLWALAITLAALDISGVVRAEVGRIWMFLMIPAAAAAGRFVAARDQAEVALGVILIAQLAQIWAFQTNLALFVVL